MTTSYIKDNGTDANVSIQLFGEKGTLPEFEINNPLSINDFAEGKTDKFTLEICDLIAIQKVRIRHDNSGEGYTWHLQSIHVGTDAGESWNIMFNRWLSLEDSPYTMQACRTR